jgi:hypothetical protein
MAKAKSGAKKASPAAKKVPASKPSLLKKATAKISQAVSKVASKVAAKAEKAPAKAAKAEKTEDRAARLEQVVKAAAKAKAAKEEQPAEASAREAKVATPAKEGKVAPAAKDAKPAPAKDAKPAAAKDAKPAAAKDAKPAAKPAAAGAKPAAPAKEEKPAKAGKEGAKKGIPVPAADRPRPRATKLPPLGQPLTKREMEQLLTAGAGRGVMGEGSLKGRLIVKDDFPHLLVIGRDKRELTFLLQGPDQEVLPAYLDHKVSVSGLVKKTTNYGGTVDVRKYSAKKPDAEVAEQAPAVENEQKLRYLSPGEVEQVSSAGMGAGIRGFATIRGNLEMTGEDFFLVVSNGGTRHQVSFLLEGKNAKGLRKYLGTTLQFTGVLEKTSGWGGRIEVENFEPRPTEFKAVSRELLEVVEVEVQDLEGIDKEPTPTEVRLNHGLSVTLPERPGHTWAIEPTVAKRVGLREANFLPGHQGNVATREFFFTPRNPGTFEVEFFLAKAFTPAQVATTFKLQVTVKP